MNSACIIAACAANSRNNPINRGPWMYTACIDNKLEIYYKINFRMYFHFNSIRVVRPVEEAYTGSVYAPVKTLFVQPVIVNARTIAKAYSFSVIASKCPNGPDKYVEDNLERFTNSAVWESAKEEIINEYLENIKQKYNIILDKNSLDYSIQYCWDVDCD